ncbi:MAG TPA: glutamate--tRNA ligase [Caldilineaceae bacterium]|nr:glutamate--tRNA ligase [Caldilineaceae bacterium]
MSEHVTPARMRFAPSPTGYLHLGGLRTALFDWLYARHTGGQFILRIEDTDQKRYNPESLADIIRGLRWLGLDWDEGPDIGGPYGPYIQSQRQPIYAAHAEQLIASGHAYRCYCTPEELEAMREEQRAKGLPQGYDRRCRYLSPAERAAREAEGRPWVVRFAAPLEGKTMVQDLIRGPIEVENHTIMDPVLLKADGMATYHLAAMVDDHLMKITHILRSEEWISSAPLHKLIFDAFGWEMPVLIHAPVILDPSGKGKMSKRKVVVGGKEYLALVHEFIEAGYLPEAMFNFLANIGWNYDPEQEIFSREEAIARFDVKDINPTAAALPYPKLEWLNGVYIRELAPEELHRRLVPFLAKQLGRSEEELLKSERLAKLVPLVQERIKLLTEAADKIDWAFVDASQITYPDPALLIGKGMDARQAVGVLEQGLALLEGVEPFTAAALEERFRAAAEAAGVKVGSFFAPFRVAITGRTVSPPLFESMEVLGRDETLARVHNALQALRSYAAERV